MSEVNNTCRIHRLHEKHAFTYCQNPAWPGDPQGLCILHSHYRGKDPEAFKMAVQDRWNQACQGFYDFRGVFFPSRFDPRDWFDSVAFTIPANFSEASFTDGANFSMASFTEWVNFTGASFTKSANFFGASFTEEADFTRAIFTEADFTGASFKKRANFFKASIRGQIDFLAINHGDEAGLAPPFVGYLSSLEFRDRGVLRFQDVSLAHCTFSGTDLRRSEFHLVTWGSLGGRKIIYDEVKLR